MPDEPNIIMPIFEVASNQRIDLLREQFIRGRRMGHRGIPSWIVPRGDDSYFADAEDSINYEQYLTDIMAEEVRREVDREIINALSQAQQYPSIADTLESDEAREALSRAMVEPIRQGLISNDTIRQIMGVQELPVGALAYYGNAVAEDNTSAGLDDVFVAHPPLRDRVFDNLIIED